MPKMKQTESKTPWGDKAVELLKQVPEGQAAARLEGLIRDAQRAAVREFEREVRHGILVAANGFKTTLEVAITQRADQIVTRIDEDPS